MAKFLSKGYFCTPLGSQPWAAAIRLQGSQKSFHWCGAVLISELHVLTVAHCMEDYPKDVYRVRIGDWDMQVTSRLSFLTIDSVASIQRNISGLVL